MPGKELIKHNSAETGEKARLIKTNLEKNPVVYDLKAGSEYIDKNGIPVKEYNYIGGQDTKTALVKAGGKKEPVTDENKQLIVRDKGGQVVRYGEIIEIDARRKAKKQIPGGSDLKRIAGGEAKQLEGREVKQLSSGSGGGEIALRPHLKVIEGGRLVVYGQAPKYQPQERKVIIADITEIVDRYARSLAEKKVNEKLQTGNFFKKSWVRLSEAGYVEKYFREAKEEILHNRNLLSKIEARLLTFKKGEKQPLRADADDIHYEILDSALESLQSSILERNAESKEVKQESYKDARLDAAAADLIVDFVLSGKMSRKEFDGQVETRLVPLLESAGAKQGKDRMYANSLYDVAMGYQQAVKSKLDAVGHEFGSEQRAEAERFIRGTLKLDVKLGEKASDMYQKRPEHTMAWYEKYVDHVQRGSILGERVLGKVIGKDKAGAIGRVAGSLLADPVMYAFLGNAAGRGVARATGLAAGYAIGTATGIAFMPATLAILGTGIGAGLYLKARAAREKRRDIDRRQEEAVLGLREISQHETETHHQWKAEELLTNLEKIQQENRLLSEQEKKHVAEIQARLDLQRQFGVDLIGVKKETQEIYQGKSVLENKLRKRMEELLMGKSDGNGNLLSRPRLYEFGATPQQQLAAFRRYQGDAERALIPIIEKVNKEKADLIREYSNKVGVRGGAIAMGAAVLGPVAGKALKIGANYFGAHFDVSNSNFAEEVVKSAWKKLSGHGSLGVDHYPGGLVDSSLSVVHAKLKLPPGYGTIDQGLDSHGNHLVGITGSDGKLILGAEKIPFDSAGNVADPHALDQLKADGWDIKHTAGTAGSTTPGSYSEAELRADGFAHNPRADWHHIHDAAKELSKHIFNGKELEAYKHILANGDEQWDVNKILNNLEGNAGSADALAKLGKFGVDNQGNIDPSMMALKEQLMNWYAKGGRAEIAKHLVMRVISSEHENKAANGLSKIVGHFDTHGKLDLAAKYADATYKEIAIIDDSGQAHVLATEHLAGHEMMHAGAAGAEANFDFLPPVGFDDPWTLAGYRRETNQDFENRIKDAEAAKQSREADAKAKKEKAEKAGAQKSEGESRPHEGEPEQERLQKAAKEIKQLVDKKEFSESSLADTAKKWALEQESLAENALEALGVDYKKNEATALEAAKSKGIKAPTKLELSLLMILAVQAGFDLKEAPGSPARTPDDLPKGTIEDGAEDVGDKEESRKKANAEIFAPVTKETPVDKKPGKTKNPTKVANIKDAPDKKPAKPEAAPKAKKAAQEKGPSTQEAIFKEKYPNLRLNFRELDNKKVNYEASRIYSRLNRALEIVKKEKGMEGIFDEKNKWKITFVPDNQPAKKKNNTLEIPFREGISPYALADILVRLVNGREPKKKAKAAA